MKKNNFYFLLLFVMVLSLSSCETENKEIKVSQETTNDKITEKSQSEQPVTTKTVLSFSEFAKVFIDKSKTSEENFLKYCSEKVNKQDPSKSYKTFLSYARLKPVIKEGSITFTKKDVSIASGDPVVHIYKMIFKKNELGDYKLTSTTYKYDRDWSRP